MSITPDFRIGQMAPSFRVDGKIPESIECLNSSHKKVQREHFEVNTKNHLGYHRDPQT